VPESAQAQVDIVVPATTADGKPQTSQLTSGDLRQLLRSFPDLTFKLVVESCFSGRWRELSAVENLRIIVASSQRDQFTYGYGGGFWDWKGTQRDGVLTTSWEPTFIGSNPFSAGPFTWAVTEMIKRWSDTPSERSSGDDLGAGIAYAGKNQSEENDWEQAGYQQAVVVDRTKERPHAPPPAPPGGQPPPQPQPPPSSGPVAFGVGNLDGSYRHIGPGQSEVCFAVQTSPARPNADVEMTVTGPGVVSPQPVRAKTDGRGYALVRSAIDAYGKYEAKADVTASDGGKASGSGSVTVAEAQGGCPPP
jgi:hypothetical protein